MALSWLVLMICFLTYIQAQQHSYLNEQIPIIEGNFATLNWTGIFPSKLLKTPCVTPVDQSNIDQIQDWYDDSTDDLLYAKSELEKRMLYRIIFVPSLTIFLSQVDDTSVALFSVSKRYYWHVCSPAEIDWRVSLYHLIIAYIVNFRYGALLSFYSCMAEILYFSVTPKVLQGKYQYLTSGSSPRYAVIHQIFSHTVYWYGMQADIFGLEYIGFTGGFLNACGLSLSSNILCLYFLLLQTFLW